MTNRAILLVTGSRAYPGPIDAIDAIVEPVIEEFTGRATGRQCVLMHGACPMGRVGFSIDVVAHGLALKHGFDVWSRPVDHSIDGPWPAAGPRRNARMVSECVREREAGAIVLVAGFPHPDPGKRRGTNGCLKLARSAGLEVIRA